MEGQVEELSAIATECQLSADLIEEEPLASLGEWQEIVIQNPH